MRVIALLPGLLAATIAACGPETAREGGRFGTDGGAYSSTSSSGWTTSSGGSSTSSGSGAVVDAGPPTVDETRCPLAPSLATPPEVTQALAAADNHLIALVPSARVLSLVTGSWQATADFPAGGFAVDTLADGRWVIGQLDQVLLEGQAPRAVPVGRLVARMSVAGNAVWVPSTEGAWSLTADGPWPDYIAGPRVACSAAALTSWNGRLVLAAPDWPAAMVQKDAGWVALAPHGLFTEETSHSPTAYAAAPSRRILLAVGADLVEIASFGTQARLLFHHAAGGADPRDLPAGSYRSARAVGVVVVMAAMQPGGNDALVVMDPASVATPALVSPTFTGPTVGLAAINDAVFALTANALLEFHLSAAAVDLVATHHP